MIDKVQLQKDIDAMREKLQSMEDDLKKPAPNSKVFKPVKGDTTYGVFGEGSIWEDKFDETNEIHMNRIGMGNLYRTQAEAEHAVQVQCAKVRVLNALREHEGDWEANWSDCNQHKYCPTYSHGTTKFSLVICWSMQNASPEFYSTQEALQWVLDNMEDDLKLVYGVK